MIHPRDFRWLVLPLALAVTGCGEGGTGSVPAEVLLQRANAFRVACAAAAIEETAAENLELLEATATFYEEADSAGGRTPTANAAVQFARGFHQHAALRRTVYAFADSAANHSPSPADSARFAARAQAFAVRTPDEGTIERNVVDSYENNLSQLLNDADHRCNWDVPQPE